MITFKAHRDRETHREVYRQRERAQHRQRETEKSTERQRHRARENHNGHVLQRCGHSSTVSHLQRGQLLTVGRHSHAHWGTESKTSGIDWGSLFSYFMLRVRPFRPSFLLWEYGGYLFFCSLKNLGHNNPYDWKQNCFALAVLTGR